MQFNLDPTQEFDCSQKDDLVIAGFFNMVFPSGTTKQVVKMVLQEELFLIGILPEPGDSLAAFGLLLIAAATRILLMSPHPGRTSCSLFISGNWSWK